VEEVRKARREIEAACQNDPRKYYERLLEMQKEFASRLVRRVPKPALASHCVAESGPKYGKKDA
jgi:hypothetical protein